ncbi:DUF3102 domain-containing protein [Gloeothece verrucosa]|uniref:DUF3102 domain-containing protein n=1 Tax=Gloeothece verrucosa (strain PCC 7822) TaxID=497965 RepID=E0ULP3_GLOV7|nr:DUF3102 domain-containing protein [Gloeothece verrucosa]ADN17873.1 hypothetical protein Cyan7822_6026 [Gloeothece verrucosa PCC 7822]
MKFSNSLQVTKFEDESLSQILQQQITDKISSFDYAVLSPEIRNLVQNRTCELKSLMRRSAQDMIEIGQKLIEVKEQLGHGYFRAWLKTEFEWSIRTATRFMQVTTQFKAANLDNLNIAVSALYLLAVPSTPEKARQEVLELAQRGQTITYSKAKAIIKFHQQEAQLQAKLSSQSLNSLEMAKNQEASALPSLSPPSNSLEMTKDQEALALPAPSPPSNSPEMTKDQEASTLPAPSPPSNSPEMTKNQEEMTKNQEASALPAPSPPSNSPEMTKDQEASALPRFSPPLNSLGLKEEKVVDLPASSEPLNFKRESCSKITEQLIGTLSDHCSDDNWLSRKFSKTAFQLEPEISPCLRILNIQPENSALLMNIAHTFELSFSGTRVTFEGDLKALFFLFKYMQNNACFAEQILQQVRYIIDDLGYDWDDFIDPT